MLERLRIKNFKAWTDTGEIQLAPLTIFFGTNSSGKTSLHHAISWHSRAVADDARSEPKPRRKPRLGIIIRMAIYVPLLGFFGWRAWERFSNEREAADEVFREHVGQWLEHPPQTIMLPNGEALPMLTPEQAEAAGYDLPESLRERAPAAPEAPAE